MSAVLDNTWAGLAPLASHAPANEQVAYLQRMIALFHNAQDSRIKALRRKLDAALVDLSQGDERGTAPEALAQGFASQLENLRRETLDLVLVLTNQVRGTLRAKLSGGMPLVTRQDTEKLHESLTTFSKGLRQVLVAAQNGDVAEEHAAARVLDEALRKLGDLPL